MKSLHMTLCLFCRKQLNNQESRSFKDGIFSSGYKKRISSDKKELIHKIKNAGGGGRTRTVLPPRDFENCRQLCKSLQSFAVYGRMFPVFGALQAL